MEKIMLDQNQSETSENLLIEQSENIITPPVIPAPIAPIAIKEISICKYCYDMEKTGKPEHPIDFIVRESKYLHWYWVIWSNHSEKKNTEVHASYIHQSELYKFWQQQKQTEHGDINLGYEEYPKICGAS